MITIEMPAWLAVLMIISLFIEIIWLALGDTFAHAISKHYKLVEKEESEMACKRKGCGKGKRK